ncbi:hypothetical protein FG379_002183 [Cryptosporidium bovis]|uniref:uncharacterized protein n=1 Tax=Cryptosporidium bovis TaxID=310047 RepID=UPI00351A6EE1|nr:hypothetical protein FG379_002183 [Cryptosporidium bovis]
MVESEINNGIKIINESTFLSNVDNNLTFGNNLNITNTSLTHYDYIHVGDINVYKAIENDTLNKLIRIDLIDSILNSTILQIVTFKSALTLHNNTEFSKLDNKFNETYTKYKKDVMLILKNFDLEKEKMFENINIESQKKLYSLIKGNTTFLNEKDGRENYDNIGNTPINYINGLDLDIWNEMLDLFTSLSISLLNNNKSTRNDKVGIDGYLNRKSIIDISRSLNNMLLSTLKITEKSNCNQIAWNLIYEDASVITGNYYWMIKKQIKKYQSSTLILLNKNSQIINEYNSIMEKFGTLDSNIKGLLDLLINVRSNKLNSLVTVEDVYNDIKSLREYSLELNDQHNKWIVRNIWLMKPLISWFETTITLLYKIWFDILKSVLSSKIRNIGDFIKTIKKDLGGDILKMETLFDKSLIYFESLISSLNNRLISMRNDIKSEIFLGVLNKLNRHYEYLNIEYKKIINEIVTIVMNEFEVNNENGVSKLSVYSYYEQFLKYLSDLLNTLWNPDLLNPFKFDKNSEYHLSIINGLFKKVSSYLNSEIVIKSSSLDNNINKLRYFNEMMFLEFILQMNILNNEFDKYQTTGRYNEEVLYLLTNRIYLNKYIQKCNISLNNQHYNLFNIDNIYNAIYKKNSVWQFEKRLIEDNNELQSLTVDYILNNKARSLLVDYYHYMDNLHRNSNQERNDVVRLNNQYLSDLRKIRNKLAALKKKMNNTEKEYSNIDKFFEERTIKNKNKIDEYIKEIDIIFNNLTNIDEIKVESIIKESKKMLDKYGYNILDREIQHQRRVDNNTQISTINKYKIELKKYKEIINKHSTIINKIASYNFEIKVLEEHINMIEKYLDHLEGQINLYCNRINKDNDKISRSLYILKYMIRKKRPDTQCERLILDFSSAKSNVSDLTKDYKDIVAEFVSNINLCREIQDTTKNYKEIIYDYQKIKEDINNLKKITYSKSFNDGTYIIDKNMRKLSQKSKLISKELLCYFNSISTPGVTLYIEEIKKMMFKLQNTLEKEIKDSLYN